MPVAAAFETTVDAAEVRRVVLSPAACARWLGTKVSPNPGVPFECPVAPSLRGTIMAFDRGSGSVVLDVDGRRVTVAIAAGPSQRTQVTVADETGGDDVATLAAWNRALAVARELLGEYVRRVPRQAVVVIHGIGEQRPGTTIRSFVDAVIEETGATVWSKPDRMAENMELRRHQAVKSDTRPQTDFFEYYWANEVAGTTLDQIKGWIVGLLKRPWRSIPSRFRAIWVFARLTVILAAAALALVALGLLTGVVAAVSDAVEWWGGWTEGAFVAAVLSAVSGMITGLLRLSLGDAVRYLTAKPDNISIRRSIRKNGLHLIRQLHECGDYDRIVLVGHSLGSVIGYDLIRLYWAEVCWQHRAPDAPEREALKAYETALEPYERYRIAARTQRQPPPDRVAPPPPDSKRALWMEQRANGNPWLITDFITLGSPLTYASLLLAEGAEDLDDQQARREFPTDPPRPEHERRVSYRARYRADQDIRDIWLLNHGAPFAVTNWTNIYFGNRLLVFGDPIGGPVAPQFGDGVNDIAIDHQWKVASLHSAYWRSGSPPGSTARAALLDALSLDSLTVLEDLAGRLPADDRLRGTVE